jgi:hypothetical protein
MPSAEQATIQSISASAERRQHLAHFGRLRQRAAISTDDGFG